MKRYLLISALLLGAALAGAQTTPTIKRFAGAGTGMALSTHPAVPDVAAGVASCIAAVPAGASYTCKVQGTKAVATTPAASAPAPAPAPAPSPTPSESVTYYFSDCQPGAAPGCVPGSNANTGTLPSAPKQNLAGFDVNSLPAGAVLRFKAGGNWAGAIQVRNRNATLAQPLVFESYGTGPAPTLANFDFGAYQDTAIDGGYILRNLRLVGPGSGYGVFVHLGTRGVVLDNMEITNFEIGVHAQQSAGLDNQGLTIRNSNIHHNVGMGMLGDAIDLVIEGTTFASNNFSGSVFNHAIYLSGQGRNGRITGNTFTNNSAVNGVCTGGNVTVHGQWDGLVIEGNTITQAASTDACYGFSVTPGYAGSAEWFRGVVLRGNTVRNVGCAVCAIAAPGVLIERNTLVSTETRGTASIVVRHGTGEDAQADGAVVRDNILCGANMGAVVLAVAGTQSGTVRQATCN